MPTPHPVFRYIRADEVAECWADIPAELHNRLWRIADFQPPIPNIEDSGPADHIGHAALSNYWDTLTQQEQAKLNILAARQHVREGDW